MAIKVFRVNDLGKWMHQNEAEHTEWAFEGCLLDNFMLKCKRGWCAVYERYATPNSSVHEFHFAAYSDEDAVQALWEKFVERYEEAALAEWMNGLMEGSAA